MTRRRAPRAPSYLYFDRERDCWCLRFRYVDSTGRAHWPREKSPHPGSYQLSQPWANRRRLEIIDAIERECRATRETVPTLGGILEAYRLDAIARGVTWSSALETARKSALRALGESTPYSDLSPTTIAAWRASLQAERGISNRTANRYADLVARALRHAASVGMIAASPLAGLRRLREVDRQPPALSPDQVAALLAAVRGFDARGGHDLETRVLLGYYLGGRPSAMDRLRWSELDLERGVAAYRSKGHRVVCPLEPELLAHLSALPRRGEYVVPSTRGRGGPVVVNWRVSWRRLVAAAGLPAGTTLHQLRHSRISHLLLDGVSPQAVAQMTGTSLAMLTRHYAHLMTGSLEAELARARERRGAPFAHGQTQRPKMAPGGSRATSGANARPGEDADDTAI